MKPVHRNATALEAKFDTWIGIREPDAIIHWIPPTMIREPTSPRLKPLPLPPDYEPRSISTFTRYTNSGTRGFTTIPRCDGCGNRLRPSLPSHQFGPDERTTARKARLKAAAGRNSGGRLAPGVIIDR